MTSAVRDAANGAAFAQRVHDALGFEARILSGDEEARLTYAGATGGPRRRVPRDRHRRRLDRARARRRLPRLDPDRRRPPQRAPPAQRPADAARSSTTSRATSARLSKRTSRCVCASGETAAIAVAGTPTQCAAIDLGLEHYDPARVEGHILTAVAPARAARPARGAPARAAARDHGPRPDPRARDRRRDRDPARSSALLRPGYRSRPPSATSCGASRAQPQPEPEVKVQIVRPWTSVRLLSRSSKVENSRCRTGGRASRRRPPTHRSGRCRNIGASRRLDHSIGPSRHVPLPVLTGPLGSRPPPPRAAAL